MLPIKTSSNYDFWSSNPTIFEALDPMVQYLKHTIRHFDRYNS